MIILVWPMVNTTFNIKFNSIKRWITCIVVNNVSFLLFSHLSKDDTQKYKKEYFFSNIKTPLKTLLFQEIDLQFNPPQKYHFINAQACYIVVNKLCLLIMSYECWTKWNTLKTVKNKKLRFYSKSWLNRNVIAIKCCFKQIWKCVLELLSVEMLKE